MLAPAQIAPALVAHVPGTINTVGRVYMCAAVHDGAASHDRRDCVITRVKLGHLLSGPT
jgi:hypothetical protein